MCMMIMMSLGLCKPHEERNSILALLNTREEMIRGERDLSGGGREVTQISDGEIHCIIARGSFLCPLLLSLM